jgi:hypothetical protein
MSDLSAVDRLREQLELAMTDVVLGWGVLPYVKAENAVAVDLVPLAMAALHAYGDAREAAGREQERDLQLTLRSVELAAGVIGETFNRDADVTQEWIRLVTKLHSERRQADAARGSGVAVQPTPGSALKEGNPQQ